MTDADRYDGMPMKRLLDAYALDAIGLLDEKTDAGMTALLPTLAPALEVPDAQTWQQMVEQALRLPAGWREAMNKAWAHYSSDVRASGHEPDPVTFTRGIIDSQFG